MTMEYAQAGSVQSDVVIGVKNTHQGDNSQFNKM